MSATNSYDPGRFIPDKLEQHDETMNIETGEFYFIVQTAIVGMLASGIFFTGTPVLIGTLIFAGLGAFCVWKSPSHLTTQRWIRGYIKQFQTPNTVSFVPNHEGTTREQKLAVETSAYEVTERTQNYPEIQRIYKGHNVIEREDGTIVAGVRVDPLNMALADEDDWKRVTDGFERYLDNDVDYPIQIYVTSEAFDVSEHTQDLRRRAGKTDLERRPIMQHTIEQYHDWYWDTYYDYVGGLKREFYVMFPVAAEDIHDSRYGERSTFDILTDIPILSDYIEIIYTPGSKEEVARQRKQKIDLAINRAEHAIHGGLSKIPNIDSRLLSAAELAVLNKEYWESESLNHDNPERLISDGPAIQRKDVASTDEEMYVAAPEEESPEWVSTDEGEISPHMTDGDGEVTDDNIADESEEVMNYE